VMLWNRTSRSPMAFRRRPGAVVVDSPTAIATSADHDPDYAMISWGAAA
jgi:hypothetical protein